jgi:hypothetical protein
MISGPYRSGAHSGADKSRNLRLMNEAAYQVFQKGHVPIIGVNLALPVIDAAGQESYDDIMMPLSIALAKRCDGVLRIGGPSLGADQEVEVIRRRGGQVFHDADEITVQLGTAEDV